MFLHVFPLRELIGYDTVLVQSGPLSNRPKSSVRQVLERMAEGEGFEPPRASRPGGFQVHCLAS